MICEKCGVILPDNLEFCTNCGAMIEDEYNESTTRFKINKFFKVVIALALAVVMIIGASEGISHIRINMLHSNIKREWRRYYEDGTVLEFNITNDSIEYAASHGPVRKTLANFEYDVVSPEQIVILNSFGVYEVKLNKDKTKMTITPAITSTDSSEEWFYLE